jgi:hypothetical protein
MEHAFYYTKCDSIRTSSRVASNWRLLLDLKRLYENAFSRQLPFLKRGRALPYSWMTKVQSCVLQGAGKPTPTRERLLF